MFLCGKKYQKIPSISYTNFVCVNACSKKLWLAILESYFSAVFANFSIFNKANFYVELHIYYNTTTYIYIVERSLKCSKVAAIIQFENQPLRNIKAFEAGLLLLQLREEVLLGVSTTDIFSSK